MSTISLSETNCANVIRQGPGLYFAKQLAEKLTATKFSIIPDETTDVSAEKQLGIVVVYCNSDSVDVCSQFFDLVPIEDCRAKGIYAAIKNSFHDKDISMNNLIWYSSDTTNVMFGCKDSVVALLKDYPSVIAVRCSCHMKHLCASYACLKLPTSLEDMLKNIYVHFSVPVKGFIILKKNFKISVKF